MSLLGSGLFGTLFGNPYGSSFRFGGETAVSFAQQQAALQQAFLQQGLAQNLMANQPTLPAPEHVGTTIDGECEEVAEPLRITAA